MCVIIQRNPGVTIPFDKLKTACAINKHGFGLAVADRGKMTITRSIEDNDPDKVAKLLEDAKNQQVFLHLRHATVGKVSLENSHPFQLLNKKEDGNELYFMHNGTLYDFDPKEGEGSDTERFCNTLARPLTVHINRSVGPDKLLLDALLFDLLHDYAKTTNVFLLFDNEGRHLAINEKRGASFDGWWASNDYSFQESHHRFRTARSGHEALAWERTYYGAAWEDFDNGHDLVEEYRERRNNLQNSANQNKQGVLWPNNDPEEADADRLEQSLNVAAKINLNGDTNVAMDMHVIKSLNTSRQSFLKLSGLDSLNQLGKLTEEQIISLTESYPKAMAAAIVDLLRERAGVS